MKMTYVWLGFISIFILNTLMIFVMPRGFTAMVANHYLGPLLVIIIIIQLITWIIKLVKYIAKK